MWLPSTEGRIQTVGEYDYLEASRGGDLVSGTIPINLEQAQMAHPQVKLLPVVLVGGVKANNVIGTPTIGYHIVAELQNLIASTADTWILTHQDEDDVAAEGGVDGVVHVTTDAEAKPGWIGGLGHGLIFKFSDDKAAEVDVSGGAGAEHLLLQYLVHQEPN